MSDALSDTATQPPRRSTAARLGLTPTNRRLLILLTGLLVVFALVVGRDLFSPAALLSIGMQLPEFAILSMAMMLTLLSGGLDLSIIATADLSALAAAAVLHQTAGPGAILLAVLAGLGVALVIGLINGILIALLDVSPILATLGTMTAVKGIGVGLTHGGVISGFPAAVTFLGNGRLLGIPFSLFILAAVAVPLALMLSKSPLGAYIAITGTDARVVRYSGISTHRVIIKVYILSALLSAIAGFIMMGRFNSANPSYGESYLLVTILAAVLGGVDPNGGFGKLGGLLIALVILQLISTAFNLLGFSPFLTLAIWGGTLIATAGTTVLKETLALGPLLRRK